MVTQPSPASQQPSTPAAPTKSTGVDLHNRPMYVRCHIRPNPTRTDRYIVDCNHTIPTVGEIAKFFPETAQRRVRDWGYSSYTPADVIGACIGVITPAEWQEAIVKCIIERLSGA